MKKEEKEEDISSKEKIIKKIKERLKPLNLLDQIGDTKIDYNNIVEECEGLKNFISWVQINLSWSVNLL